MIKQLGIAAACGIALYGLARYIRNNHVFVIGSSGEFPDLFDAGTNAHDDAEAEVEVPDEGDVVVTMPRVAEQAAGVEVACTQAEQTPPPDDTVQATP
jgi:hypothetical protein